MKELAELTEHVSACHSLNELTDISHLIARQMGFQHFFILGAFFNNYSEACTEVITNYCKTPKYRYSNEVHDMLEELIDSGMTTVTPIIRGKLRTKTISSKKLPENIQHIYKLDVHTSISFPVHFPSGQFAMVHFGTHLHNNIDFHAAMLHGYQFALRISARLLSILEKPFPTIMLSEREKSCLLMACDGVSPGTISNELGLSVHTVQYYLKNVRKKMCSKNLQNALSNAICQGQLRPQHLTGSRIISGSVRNS